MIFFLLKPNGSCDQFSYDVFLNLLNLAASKTNYYLLYIVIISDNNINDKMKMKIKKLQ